MKQKVRWAKTRSAAISLVVTLSLLLQILFIPYHQASGALAFVGSDAARVEALLKATFGDAAALCVQSDDGSKAPKGCCDNDCPFCRFAAEAATLVIPDFPALPIRRNVAARIGLPPEPRGPPATPIRRQRARAPPDPV
ncbi:MAG TPA: hypothetical protein VMS87_09090 [Roseiarcus sp.]|nr:hypothetical protein [Roseiarcus sp.]